MSLVSSLSNRIFLATALLTVLSIGAALLLVNVAVTRRAEADLERGLEEAGELVAQFQQLFFEHLVREARLIADLPRLKAAVYDEHAPTARPVAEEYRQATGADLVLITNRTGGTLAVVGDPGAPPARLREMPALREALAGRPAVDLWATGDGVLQVVSVPIAIDPGQPELLGTFTAGLSLSRRLADRIRAVTRSEVLFVDRGRVRASTLPPSVSDTVLRETGPGRISRIAIGGEEYEAVWRPLTLTPREPISGAQPAVQLAPGDGDGPHVVVLRSRTAHLAFLSTLHTALGFIALLAILVATLLSYAVARTVTRPLRALTATMREMAATGNLAAARPPAESRWEDEDARLLTRTFHGLTQALVRFHREAAQRERLSSLGRLSTVLAHEIRNPLMIIKTSLRTLRRGTAGGADVSAAIADIEGEVARLNRIVHEVLDYARPITFTYGEVDLAHVVRDAAYAALAALPGPEVEVEAPERLQVTTDGERVRQALVNVLSNAREAVVAAADGEVTGASLPPVRLLLAEHGDEQVQIVVRDQGVGIAPEHLARLFEPFFTTKRAGSGIGLAIARNIVDGLGGTIAVESSAGQGTTVRLTLPRRPQDAAAAPLAAAVAGPEPAVHS